MKTTATLRAEIAKLEAPMLMGSNAGTFSNTEALCFTGSGDTSRATRNVYQCLDGSRRVTGPEESRMPGLMRWFPIPTPARRRTAISELKMQLARQVQAEEDAAVKASVLAMLKARGVERSPDEITLLGTGSTPAHIYARVAGLNDNRALAFLLQ